MLRDEGLRALALKILGETVYRRALLMERPLHEPIPEVSARVPLAIAPLRGSEIGEYLVMHPDAEPAEICRRLAAGEWCVVARRDGRIVHTVWLATGRAWIEYLEREIRLGPDEVYTYQSFTAPDARGLGVASARVNWTLRFLRGAGYRRALTIHVPENPLARVPLVRGGYRPIEVLGYVRLGAWRRNFRRPLAGQRAADPAPDAPAYWDAVVARVADGGHYLDPFLGELKRRAYLGLVRDWGGSLAAGPVLKTDLFEEAVGPDALLGDLASQGRLVMGVDLSPAVTARARRRDPNQSARYVVADVRALPFATGVFALIVSPSTLDHFGDPRDLGRGLGELHRVLRPDGKLIVTVDNRANVFDPILRLAQRCGRTPYYLGRSYTVAELRAELESAGFAVPTTTAILHNPRLVAVAAVALARRLGWRPVTGLVERALTAAQRLGATRWRYRSGSFVAALAVRQGAPGAGSDAAAGLQRQESAVARPS